MRVQALVCFDIDEDAAPEQSGSIATCARFHHWLGVAQSIFHPHTGVDGMRLPEEFLPVLDTDETYMLAPVDLKENAGRAGRYAHRFMMVPPERFKLEAMSAYIRLAEAFAAQGAEALAPLYSTCSGAAEEVEGVSYAAMAAHIAALDADGAAVALPADGRLLGEVNLALRAVPLKAGEMVCWDSTVPHHNVAASADNTRARMSAYVDMAPADAGNYAPPAEQVANQAQRLLSSTVGTPENPNNQDELEHLIPAWESLPLDYRLKCEFARDLQPRVGPCAIATCLTQKRKSKPCCMSQRELAVLECVVCKFDRLRVTTVTTDGKYAHLKATPLLKALYGFDPGSGDLYSWEQYKQEAEAEAQQAKL